MAPVVKRRKVQGMLEYFTKKLAFLFPQIPVYLSRVAPDEEDEELLRPVWDNTPISINMVDCLYNIMEKHIIQDTKTESRGSNENRLGLTFTYIDGPKKKLDVKYREGMLRPGLYAGFYHRDMYGKYCKECLLIEYKSYTFLEESNGAGKLENANTWRQIQADIFNHNSMFQQRDPQSIFNQTRLKILKTNTNEVIFIIARKVTGDVHVPSGAITFGALIHPQLESDEDKNNLPKKVRDRDRADIMYDVIKHYPGWGTLAYPGFRNPSWIDGNFLQVESDASGGHRFGFQWGSDSTDFTVTILSWIGLQDDFPWFEK